MSGLAASSAIRVLLITGMYASFLIGALYLHAAGVLAMANVAPADAGMASGIVNTSLQLSGALGVAVLGTIATEHTRALAAAGDSARSALLGGYHVAFLVALACVAAAAVAAPLILRAPHRAEAEPASARPSRAAS